MKKRTPLRMLILVIFLIVMYLILNTFLDTRFAVKVLLTVGIVFLGEQTFDIVMQRRK